MTEMMNAALGDAIKVASGPNLSQQWVAAQTDGFALADVGSYSADNLPLCTAYAAIWSAGWHYATGGSYGLFDSKWNYWKGTSVNCVLVPVKAGTNWAYWAGNDPSNEVQANITVSWFPMTGQSQRDGQTYRLLDPNEVAEKDLPDPLPVRGLSLQVEDRLAAAEGFIAALERGFDQTLSEDTRAQLAQQLCQLK
ncbi:hypothetical protein ACW9HJ_25265 [Nocardia gipuzkoensis]